MSVIPNMHVRKKSHVDMRFSHVNMRKSHVTMRFVPNMHFWKKTHVDTRFFLFLHEIFSCQHEIFSENELLFACWHAIFNVKMRFFPEHAIFFRTCMFEKKIHVRKNRMLTLQIACWHAIFCMLTCKNFMSTCEFLPNIQHVRKQLHVNIDNIDIHLQISCACWHAFSCMWTYKQQLATDDQQKQ